MTIKEVLQSYYAPPGPLNPVYQTIQNKRLAGDFAVWALTDKTLAWFYKMLTKYNQTEIHPGSVVELCAGMGILTWEQLLKYIEAVNGTTFNGAALYDHLNPTIDVSRFTKKTDQYEIYHILRQHGIVPPIGNDAWPYYNDVDYYLIPDDMVKEILKKSPAWRYQYTPELRDCDDTTRIIRGWTSQQGIGNMTLGEIQAELLWQGSVKYAHSFLVLINESREMWYAEGQEEYKIWKPGEHPGISGVDAIGKIIDMIF